jgi:hypothetical protein
MTNWKQLFSWEVDDLPPRSDLLPERIELLKVLDLTALKAHLDRAFDHWLCIHGDHQNIVKWYSGTWNQDVYDENFEIETGEQDAVTCSEHRDTLDPDTVIPNVIHIEHLEQLIEDIPELQELKALLNSYE